MALLTDEVYRENLEKFKNQRTAMLARREKVVRLLQGSLSEKQKRMVESQEAKKRSQQRKGAFEGRL